MACLLFHPVFKHIHLILVLCMCNCLWHFCTLHYLFQLFNIFKHILQLTLKLLSLQILLPHQQLCFIHSYKRTCIVPIPFKSAVYILYILLYILDFSLPCLRNSITIHVFSRLPYRTFHDKLHYPNNLAATQDVIASLGLQISTWRISSLKRARYELVTFFSLCHFDLLQYYGRLRSIFGSDYCPRMFFSQPLSVC